MANLSNPERLEIRRLIETKAKKEKCQVEAGKPNWEEEVKVTAHKIAVAALGIGAKLGQLRELNAEIVKLNSERNELEAAIEKQLPKKETKYRSACATHMSICEALNTLEDTSYEAAMEKYPIGKKLNEIEAKKTAKIVALLKCSTREDVKECGCLDW